MTQYNYKFVVINEIPTGTTPADNLSIQLTRDYGREGWELVDIMAIPNSRGLLLTLQKTIPTND